MIAVLGAGPHGRQIAHDLRTDLLYDDMLSGYQSTKIGAAKYEWLVGAVWPKVRRQIAEQHDQANLFADGNYVAPSANLGIDLRLGKHVHILAGANVSHGCWLGNYVTIATGANVCGEALIGNNVFVGAGATIIHGGISIGDGAVIGAGAVVLHDVPAGMTVVGAPARCR